MLMGFLFLCSLASAQPSQLLPLFQEAVRDLEQKKSPNHGVQLVRDILLKEGFESPWLRRFLLLPPRLLPAPLAHRKSRPLSYPLALHAARLDVIKTSDDVFRDDIYCYFLVTDGTIPTGHVSQIYRGLSPGESFHFTAVDRVLFPLGRASAIPRGPLVIDYGIVESDGDDVSELQRLTGLVSELALAVYAVMDPVQALQWGSLRQEIVALTQALVSLNHDDRLASGTIVLEAEEIERVLGGETIAEIQRVHQNNHFFHKWRYRLVWRLIKDEHDSFSLAETDYSLAH